MIDLLFEGGILFMGTLTVFFLVNILLIVRNGVFINTGKFTTYEAAIRSVDYVKYVGVLAFTFGILGQFIGLYSGFAAIQQLGTIAPDLLAGGLKVSSIASIYGMIIFVLSYGSWLVLKLMIPKSLG
jgi:hypothetical protein